MEDRASRRCGPAMRRDATAVVMGAIPCSEHTLPSPYRLFTLRLLERFFSLLVALTVVCWPRGPPPAVTSAQARQLLAPPPSCTFRVGSRKPQSHGSRIT